MKRRVDHSVGRRGAGLLLCLACAPLLVGSRTAGAQVVDSSAVIAEIHARQPAVLLGHPVWVDFSLFNPTDEVVIVYLSGLKSVDLDAAEMGLPAEHVLGKPDSRSLVVLDHDGREIDVGHHGGLPDKSIAVRLAPQTLVGRRLDVSLYCPALLKRGRYKLQWRPYDGALQSNIIELHVVPLKQARIETDHGPMNIRFFYDDAPRHVENFIELSEQDFYDNLTFHRVVPGYLIQGGARKEDPAAIRPDGQVLDPEFNDRPFDRGTVAMARRPNDPNSASCQFFICGTRWPELDGEYSAFGELFGEVSFDTLDKLMALPVGNDGRPLRKVYIRTVRIQDVPKAERARAARKSSSGS